MTTYKRHPLNKKRPAPHVIRAQRLQRTGLRPSDIQQIAQAMQRLNALIPKLFDALRDAISRALPVLAPPPARSDYALMPPRPVARSPLPPLPVTRTLPPPAPVTRTRYTPPTN